MGRTKIGGLVDDEIGVRGIGSILGQVFKFLEVEMWRKWLEMGLGLRWRAQIWSIWIDNDLIKRLRTLPGPGEAIFEPKLQK